MTDMLSKVYLWQKWKVELKIKFKCQIYRKLALISYAHGSDTCGLKTVILNFCTLFIPLTYFVWCDQYKWRRVGNNVTHTSDW